LPEVGEELVGAWLRLVAECDFVQYNVPLRGKQGEIDVIGLHLPSQTAYICEVATHTGGLQYNKNSQPNNVNKITRKFQDDVNYAREYLPNFDHRFMLWSPIVRYPTLDTVKHSQFRDLIEISNNLQVSHQAKIEMIINEIYLMHVDELRFKATEETAASEYPVFRLLQILHRLENHVKKLKARGIDSSAMLMRGLPE
jgi:hypothetical protein